MIQNHTYLNVADNTGAKSLMCITVLSRKSKFASLGDILVGVVKFCFYIFRINLFFFINFFLNLYFFIAIPNMLVKKSEIVKAVVVRTKKGFQREGLNLIKFSENAVVIINSDKSPRGTV